ncbi:unnamed protein product [Camellia sinensis]
MDGNNVVVEKPSDEDIESFLSSCVDDENNSFTKLQRHFIVITSEGKNGFSFEEFGSIHASKGKVLCCHFSSDGELLASAGHDKKCMLSSSQMFVLGQTCILLPHLPLTTLCRFGTQTSQANHSLSFLDMLDKWLHWISTQESWISYVPVIIMMRFDYGTSTNMSSHISSRQARFQPRIGNLLATASGNKINLTDVETNSLQDISGKYVASVSEDSARIWSVVSSGKCMHVFHFNGNKFESCAFHPKYSQLMVIGSYKAINIWNPTESNKTMTVGEAHDGIVASLADCSQTEIVASVSHDQTVKLWR